MITPRSTVAQQSQGQANAEGFVPSGEDEPLSGRIAALAAYLLTQPIRLTHGSSSSKRRRGGQDSCLYRSV
eukprot:2647184-Amphidinium_carterae.2